MNVGGWLLEAVELDCDEAHAVGADRWLWRGLEHQDLALKEQGLFDRAFALHRPGEAL